MKHLITLFLIISITFLCSFIPEKSSPFLQDIIEDSGIIDNNTFNPYSQEAADYFHRGNERLADGNYEAAMEDYNKSLELDPDSERVYNNRGIVHQKQGNLREAMRNFNKAIERDPNNANAHYNRGVLYMKSGKLTEAMSDFNKAIERDPNNAEAYFNRGIVYIENKEFKEAMRSFAKAVELNPRLDFVLKKMLKSMQ